MAGYRVLLCKAFAIVAVWISMGEAHRENLTFGDENIHNIQDSMAFDESTLYIMCTDDFT